MITRRDVAVALIAVGCTAAGFAVADELPLLGSAVFDWNRLEAEADRGGVSALVFQNAYRDAGAAGGACHHAESRENAASAT